MSNYTWMEQAACVGHNPELWYSTIPDQAQKICATCPVQHHCAQHATHVAGGHGIWAGQPAPPPQQPATRYRIPDEDVSERTRQRRRARERKQHQ